MTRTLPDPLRRPLALLQRTFPVSAIAVLVAACGATPPAAEAPKPSASAAASPSGSAKANSKAPKTMDPPGLTAMITPSYLLPEVAPEKGVFAREEGHKKILVDRMRLIVNEDGSEERAVELVPNSYATAVALPSRLGGGYLFQSSGGGATQLWRTATWLGRLEPLVQIGQLVDEVVAGFDRLYIRLQSSNRMIAVDPQSGELLPLGPLPASVSYGALAFADGWRAVVDTDLRGPLATFDAGTTWRPLRLAERPFSITAITGDPMLFVSGGRYVIDAGGAMTYRPDPPRKYGTDKDREETAPSVRPPGPLGRKPLRAAIEDGFPEDGRTAIVARGGALARISLRDGSVLKIVHEAYKDRDAACHAVRIAKGYGFVCGERDGATSVHAFVPPFSLKEIWRFSKPRFVSPSGNGALVVRGACTDEPAGAGDGRTYCIRAIDGSTRQIRVTGDLGVERVVALADGRIVVLVPPRREAGQITVLRGSAVETSVALKIPGRPNDSARVAKRGLWLDGFEEREPGVIGGWVEAGGVLVGVKVAVNGEVTLGETRADPNGALVTGRFGLSVGDDGDAAESTDGGMSWTSFDLPEHQVDASPLTRACGPVGCALANWLRIGWGKPLVRDDFTIAKAPSAPHTALKVPSTVSMSCELLGSVTPKLPEKPAPKGAVAAKKATPASPPRYGGYGSSYGGYGYPYGYGYGYGYVPQWEAFRNTAAPALQKDEAFVDTGSYGDAIPGIRSYVWGKKGADWTKIGKWLVRFDDRFDVGGGVRTSATTAPPWADEAAAKAGVGGGMTYGIASWTAHLDPSGRAALGLSCNGLCVLYSIAEGQPVLGLRDSSGRQSSFGRLLTPTGSTSGAAVRVGESWFFLAQSGSEGVGVWRADLGVMRQIATYYRPAKARSAGLEPPRLVRRAMGSGLGLLVSSVRGTNEPSGSWYVLPLDPDTGVLDEPIFLARRDLGGAMPERCAAGQDGWLTDLTLEATPSISLGPVFAPLDSIEMRLRMDPGAVCAEGVSARVDGIVVTPSGPGKAPVLPGKPKDVATQMVPLAATERVSGQRWVFQCSRQTRYVVKGPDVMTGAFQGVIGGVE